MTRRSLLTLWAWMFCGTWLLALAAEWLDKARINFMLGVLLFLAACLWSLTFLVVRLVGATVGLVIALHKRNLILTCALLLGLLVCALEIAVLASTDLVLGQFLRDLISQ